MSARLDRAPNASLRRIGTSTRAVTDRIVTTFLEATAEQCEQGEAWYGDAESAARDIARVGGISIEHAAAVLSHLSPRTTWTRNLSGAWSLVTTGTAPSCLRANIARARRALASGDPLNTFGPDAPKTRRFARNILGDRNAVTVDVWAVRTALGPARHAVAESLLSRVGVYDAIEHAFRLAAARLGTDPTTVQATCWIVERGRSGWEEANRDLQVLADRYDALAADAFITDAELAVSGW